MPTLLQGLAGQAEESPEQVATRDWNPEDHPQGKGGLFVEKGGGGASTENAATRKESGKKRRSSSKGAGKGGIKIPKKEYAQLTSHIMQYATPEQRKAPVMTTEMGGVRYTLEKNEGYNILRIIDRVKVNAGKNRNRRKRENERIDRAH